MTELVKQASEYATTAHQRINHLRKYSKQPYHVHLEAVARLVATVTDDPEVIAAAARPQLTCAGCQSVGLCFVLLEGDTNTVRIGKLRTGGAILGCAEVFTCLHLRRRGLL